MMRDDLVLIALSIGPIIAGLLALVMFLASRRGRGGHGRKIFHPGRSDLPSPTGRAAIVLGVGVVHIAGKRLFEQECTLGLIEPKACALIDHMDSPLSQWFSLL